MEIHYSESHIAQRRLRRVLCLMVGLSLPTMLLAGSTSEQVKATRVADATTLSTNAQNANKTKIVGVVTDSKTGEPIVGAAVRLKGASAGALTDIEGNFELKASAGDVLIISSVGYSAKEVRVGKTTILSITLSEDTKTLGQVVVTAFGTGQKKETVTGSIQTVRPMELKVPAANLSTAFAGRLAGVISYQRSGEPGSNGADFFIRGISTMNGSEPLIILDGVQISKADLNAIDPEIIDSFSILKDATASAMYGTRGANGVLIIKTKSGADLERPIIGVRIENYINTPINVPKAAGAETYMRMYNEAVRNQGTGDALYSEEYIRNTLAGTDPYQYPNVDWYKEVFKNMTYNQRANMNVRGGTAKVTYFMNFNVSHETGMLRGRSKDFFSFSNSIDYIKYAFQNNVDFHLSPSASIALHLNTQINDYHGPITANNGSGGVNEVFKSIMETNSVANPIMFPQGDLSWYRWGGTKIGSFTPGNPVAMAASGYKDTFESTVIANIDYTQKLDFITKGLSFKGLVSFKNWSFSNAYRFQTYNSYMLASPAKDANGNYNLTSLGGDPSKPILNSGGSSMGDRRFYIQAYINYDRSFGDHSVSAMALYNQDEATINNPGSDLIATLPRRRQGYAFRASYDYAQRYLLEVNAGYNGSENFARGHRWGFFPSIAVGWNVSKEAFWKPLQNTVSNLKLRASYGLVGNDKTVDQRFIYLEEVVLSGDKHRPNFSTGFDGSYESRRGPGFTRYANPQITWEIGKKLNVGLDLQLFKSLNLTVDVFQEIRSNIFQKKETIPNYFGTEDAKIYGNLAKVKNWGVDVAMEYNKQFNKDWTIQARGTFTFARNRVLEYDEAANLRPALRKVGSRLNGLLGYAADGYYIDQADIDHNPKSTLGNIAIAPGDLKYEDQPDKDGNYDGKIDADDRIPMGFPTVPEINYGFGATVQYKQFDFNFTLQGQANVSLMMKDFHPFGTQSRRNVLQWVADDYWSRDNQNPNARYPRLTLHDNRHNQQESSHWLRDASFLKLRNLEVGYRFKFARVYANATNLLTFAPFKLWDPEMGGGRGMSYPLQRTFNLGVQLTFK